MIMLICNCIKTLFSKIKYYFSVMYQKFFLWEQACVKSAVASASQFLDGKGFFFKWVSMSN